MSPPGGEASGDDMLHAGGWEAARMSTFRCESKLWLKSHAPSRNELDRKGQAADKRWVAGVHNFTLGRNCGSFLAFAICSTP